MVASSGRSPHSARSCRLPCSFPSSEHALRAAGSSAVLLVFCSTDHIRVVSCECRVVRVDTEAVRAAKRTGKHNTVRRISAFRGNCNSGAILVRAPSKNETADNSYRIAHQMAHPHGLRKPTYLHPVYVLHTFVDIPIEHLLSSIGRPPHDR